MKTPFPMFENLELWAEAGCDVSADYAHFEGAAAVWAATDERELMGLELSHVDGRFCILCADPSEPGKFRAQFWDSYGLLCHTTFDTLVDVFAEVLASGFLTKAPGSFDFCYSNWNKVA